MGIVVFERHYKRFYMRFGIFALAMILYMCAGTSHGQDASSQRAGHASNGISCHASHVSSLQSILGVLNKAKLSGSLVVSGSCKSLNYPDHEIPALCVAPGNVGSPLQTLRAMFADDSAIHVTQGPNGIIRMIEKGTPTDILKVKISHLSFDKRQGGVDNANASLEIIQESPEFQKFLESHNSKWPLVEGPISILTDKNGNITPTPSYIPHISGSMENVTVEAAMDRILKTFPGIWVYESCPSSGTEKRIIYLRFYRLQNSIVE